MNQPLHAVVAHAADHLPREAVEQSESVKEIANIVTLFADRWHGTPAGHFLHQWENVFFSFFAGLILILFAYLGTRKKEMIPRGWQNLLEIAVESLDNLVTGILGPRGRKYVPFIGTLFFYILIQNLMGVVPGLKSATSSLNTTASLAIYVFFYVQWTAMKENGLIGYALHLMGEPNDLVGWLMVPLNLPLHILEEFIKPLSLSLRLFGNVLGEDALIGACVGLGITAAAFVHLPIGFPFQFPFMCLALLTGTIQALVFAMLSTIYISLMLPHEEHAH